MRDWNFEPRNRARPSDVVASILVSVVVGALLGAMLMHGCVEDLAARAFQ